MQCVMTMPLTTTYWKTIGTFPPPPQKLGRQILLKFWPRVHRTTTQNPEIFVKICRLVSDNYFETETIFSASPYRGSDAKILFLSTKGPRLHKIFWVHRICHFRDMGSKVQLSHLLPKNWVGRSRPYLAHGFLGWPPKPWKFCESLATSFWGICHFTVGAYDRDSMVSSTSITESLDTRSQTLCFSFNLHWIEAVCCALNRTTVLMCGVGLAQWNCTATLQLWACCTCCVDPLSPSLLVSGFEINHICKKQNNLLDEKCEQDT